MGNAPHELKSGSPAPETFVSGVLDGFAVGGPVDNAADVAAPVGVLRIKRNISAHES